MFEKDDNFKLFEQDLYKVYKDWLQLFNDLKVDDFDLHHDYKLFNLINALNIYFE